MPVPLRPGRRRYEAPLLRRGHLHAAGLKVRLRRRQVSFQEKINIKNLAEFKKNKRLFGKNLATAKKQSIKNSFGRPVFAPFPIFGTKMYLFSDIIFEQPDYL